MLYGLADAEFASPPTATFADVTTEHAQFQAIEWAAANGLASTAVPQFQPGEPLDRAALATFLYRLAGEPPLDPPTRPTFADVSPDLDSFTAVEWLAAEGIVDTANDQFDSTSYVTRAQMAAFLHRFDDRAEVSLDG